MFAQAKTLGLLTFAVLLFDVATAASRELKRAYEVPESQIELGAFLITQRNLAGVTETGSYVPAKWTRFHSDSLDWKFEGALSYFSRRGDDWRSAQAAAGFRYWIDGSANVTPMLRLGIARAATGERPMLALGADVLFQKSFTLDPLGRHEGHRLIVVEAQAGVMSYRGGGASSRYGFVVATVAYDRPVGWPRASAGTTTRAKVGIGLESQFGGGRAVDRLLLASLSLRSEDAATGRLFHKIELFAGIGEGSQCRLAVGYTRGF